MQIESVLCIVSIIVMCCLQLLIVDVTEKAVAQDMGMIE